MSDGFDFPLGIPGGVGYSINGLLWLGRYDYERDNILEYHPGEDWNDDNTSTDYGGDSNDAGDPVYSISNGKVIYAKYSKASWGCVVMIEHLLKNGDKYWSQYAHLKSINPKYLNKNNINILRGEEIGRIGDYPHGSGDAYHLHFEIRKKYRPATAFVMDWSREQVEEYYVNPSEFINANRPAPLPPPEPPRPEYEIINLTNSPTSYQRNQKIGAGKVIWETFGDEQSYFPRRSTLYYHDLETGENGEIKIGNFLNPIEGPHLTEINNDHFCYTGKTSRYSVSNIFCHNMKTSIDIPITNSFTNQMYPALSESGNLVWQDNKEGALYYTNIYHGTNITKVFSTPNSKHEPRIWDDIISYKEWRPDGKFDLYIVDLKNNIPIYMVPNVGYGHQDIWEDWVIWSNGKTLNLYNYMTHEKRIISEEASGIPRMQDGRIVWERMINGNLFINVYNIESEKNTVINFPLKHISEPYIFNNLITFRAPTDPLSTHIGSMDIWLITL